MRAVRRRGAASLLLALMPMATLAARLSLADVRQVAAQGEEAAERLGQQRYTLAVTDRVGNVLAVYRRGAPSDVTLDSGLSVTGGLEQVSSARTGLDLAALAAIAKAVTGAYLSSSGNAFSTRTASFIVQDHFMPGVRNTPGGPLFGVQFSQLPCGDLVQTADPGAATTPGPRRSPLGLAGDPGGFPLYRDGQVVGGVGVIAGAAARYTLDLDPRRPVQDQEERIAQAAAGGFTAPDAIRADRITAGGLRLPYSTSDGTLPRVARRTPAVSAPVAVPGYFDGVVRAGRAFGEQGSGFVAATAPTAPAALVARRAWILEDGSGMNRFPPRDTTAPDGALRAAFVAEILQAALGVANEARAQIRRPLGSAAQVTVAVVDARGALLGLARTPDAPVFGTDVSVQKARTAALFSRRDASTRLRAVRATSVAGITIPAAAPRLSAAQARFGRDVFTGTAFSARALGNLHRPNFPDGIDGRGPGPLSNGKTWSPFNVGLQLDLAQARLLEALVAPLAAPARCTVDALGVDNGIQVFPGGVPIYRGRELVGGVGVSGDGVDQDDMIAALGLARASAGPVINGDVGHAPPGMRSDTLGLRWVQCPQSPFNGSQAQDACAGL